MADYTLHSYWRSSCSWRVRWALELEGLSHSISPVNLLKSEQFGDTYVALNPNSRLPTLTFDDNVVSGSLAIIEYLEERHPEKPLYPNDLITKAKVRELVNIIACDTQPVQNLAVMKYYSDDQEKEKHMQTLDHEGTSCLRSGCEQGCWNLFRWWNTDSSRHLPHSAGI